MSDADQPPREWRFYIVDMIEFAEKVLADVGRTSRECRFYLRDMMCGRRSTA